MTNSKVISKTASSDGMKMDYMGEDFVCGVGVGVPCHGTLSVHDSNFYDFTACPVFKMCSGSREDLIGGLF